jgi:hypothetical protein
LLAAAKLDDAGDPRTRLVQLDRFENEETAAAVSWRGGRIELRRRLEVGVQDWLR